jgi:4-hydroxybutyrate dehydrogenase
MASITYLTTIRFEPGARGEIESDLQELGIERPLIVTDQGIRQAGLLDRLRRASRVLDQAPAFDDTPTNPTEEATEAAVARYRENRCDGIVALGGGSPIDLAKGVALLATHPGPLKTYAAILGGRPKITTAVAPVVAVPTTAGTGSEVGRAALITLRDGRKLGFLSPHLIPKRAVCDPELTYGLPPRLTAATGMDAITHCVETFLSPLYNPPAEAIALDGLRRAVRHLEAAVSDGSDQVARREMMMAALEGGLTFQKGLGAVHALSHPLGGLRELALHHGMLNAVLLAPVLRFNAAASVAAEKYAAIRSALGLAASADLPAFFAGLVERLPLPRTLSEMGVPAEVLEPTARAAVLDHSSATNPRPASEADYRAMLDEAFT